jgi:organic hydroperoxide reductase OsmC/OhrA
MARSHLFEARIDWRRDAAATHPGSHSVEFDGRPPLAVSAAPQYNGDPSRLNPEELLLAALVSCQMLSYLALAGRAGIDVRAYRDRATATLAVADRKMRITDVLLRPEIEIAAGGDEAKARALVDAAHHGCFIANSVSCAVRIEASVDVRRAETA